MRFLLPGAYLAFCAYTWVEFMRLPPDGMANMGVFLAVLPVSLLGFLIRILLRTDGFPFIFEFLGYRWAHALFFFPSAALCTWFIYRFVAWLAPPKKASEDTVG
jgi:hypothetical protein